MLSLLGSLQPDPFSSRHVVQHSVEGQKEETEDDETEDEDSGSELDSDSGSGSHSEEVDARQVLGKRKEVKDEGPVVEKKRKR
jgi:DNA-directed RNA polymerase I subunit RPA43